MTTSNLLIVWYRVSLDSLSEKPSSCQHLMISVFFFQDGVCTVIVDRWWWGGSGWAAPWRRYWSSFFVRPPTVDMLSCAMTVRKPRVRNLFSSSIFPNLSFFFHICNFPLLVYDLMIKRNPELESEVDMTFWMWIPQICWNLRLGCYDLHLMNYEPCAWSHSREPWNHGSLNLWIWPFLVFIRYCRYWSILFIWAYNIRLWT